MKRNQLIHKLFSLIFLFLLIVCSSKSFGQRIRGTIKGSVFSSAKEPIENVSVKLQGTKYGTVTNEDGIFDLRAPAGAYVLVVSQVGMQQQELKVTITVGQTITLPTITIYPLAGALKEVVVNGNKVNKFRSKKSLDLAKMPLANLENPQVYSTINKELITEQQLFSVDDALKNTPGLQTMWQATGRGGDGGAYYNSRGFILQSKLRNGIAGMVTSTNDAANIERVEVIKGPSSTLFGSTLASFGGLINRVTKKPYESFGGEVAFSAGSYGLGRVSADINTPLDASRKVLFRLNTAYTHTGSFQNNGFGKNLFISPSVSFKASDRLSILVDAEIATGTNSGKPIFFFPGSNVSTLNATRADQLAIDYRKTYFNDDLTQRSRSNNYFAQVNYKLSANWRSQTNITSSSSFSDGFYPYFYLLSRDTVSRNDQSTKNSKDNLFEVQQNFNGDFKIGGLRNRFVGGLDFFRENSNQFFFGSGFDKVATTLPASAYDNFNKANLGAIYGTGSFDFTYPIIFKSNTYSAYVADVLNITDQLMASAAVRVDHYRNEGAFNTSHVQTAPAFDQTAFSPKFGLVYQPVKDKVSLFANYQNGFTNPGTYTAAGTNSTAITKIAKLQQANQLEGGVKVDLFNGKLSGSVSYYNIKLTNVLRTDPSASIYAQIQDGTQLSKGIETEIIANPVAGLNIIGGFSYNDSKYTKADADVLGRRPSTASAPYSANFYVSYRFLQTAVKGLGAGFGGNYVSNNKIVNSISQGVFILPAFTVLNTSVFYEQPKYRVNLGINNLTDKKYWIGYTTINPQQLRQVVASIAYKF